MNSNRSVRVGIGVPGLEWFFLLSGLAAIDAYIWINTNEVLYQAYADWAFDQQLRALTPSIRGFVADELRTLFGRDRSRVESTELPAKIELPTPKPVDTTPLTRSAVIGRLEIPNLHLTAMVREGADSRTLRHAVGHIPGTALPGRAGNIVLAGHRDTLFRVLRNIQMNDAIELQTERGTYRYVVESTSIVGPRDVRVLESSGGQSLTLVTCYPFYFVGSAPKPFIVHAALVATVPQGRLAQAPMPPSVK
jgi:sortase A